jgi:DNA polymerase-3 subunit alpha
VKGRLDVGEDRIQVIGNEIVPLTEAAAKFRPNGNGKTGANGQRLEIYLRETEVCPDDLVRLRDTLLNYPGPCAVFLHLIAASQSEVVIELPDQVRVAPTSELEHSLLQLFGGKVSFQAAVEKGSPSYEG